VPVEGTTIQSVGRYLPRDYWAVKREMPPIMPPNDLKMRFDTLADLVGNLRPARAAAIC
jgi:hypothetical protein